MAGLIITLGVEARADHKQCFQEYAKAKDLFLSHQEIKENFCLSKFCRENESDDNVLIADDIKIWGLGSLIYRNVIGRSALKALRRDLSKNQIGDLARDLDGPFCLIIKKSTENGFWIVTDHAGISNLYKYKRGNTFAVSTSSLALSRAFTVTPNVEGIVQFLRNASICDSKTIYNEIELLEPASVFFFEFEPRVKIKDRTEYWKSPIDVVEEISFEEARDLLASRLLESMDVLSKKNSVFDFTAGFDSRLILSSILSREYVDGDIHTFVFGPNGSPEVSLVKECCERLGFANYHLTLPSDWNERFYEYVLKALHLTDGEENACVYAPILWAQEFKAKRHSYSINGLGGELYRDFWWVQELFCSKKPANLDRLIDARVLQYEYDYSIFSENWKKKMSKVKDILKNKYKAVNSDMNSFRTYNTLQIDNIYFRQKIRRWAGRTISSSNLLIKTVAPLTFKKCLEAGMSIPPKYKRHGKIVKAIIEMFSPVLAQQKMLNGTPCENLRLSNFYKFIPLASNISRKAMRKLSQRILKRTILLDQSLTYQVSTWYGAMLSKPQCNKLMSYDNMCTRKLYRRNRFERFIKDAERPGFRYHQQLGSLLTLELRMREDNLGSEPESGLSV